MSRIFLCALLTHVLLLSISETRGSKAKPHHEPAAIPVHASHMGLKPKLFIGLPSDRRRRRHRNAARETWMQMAAQTGQVITRFFVSHDGRNANMTAQLERENAEHGDMVILGPDALGPGKEFLEGIPGVTQKLFFLFEMAVTEFSPEYVARIDDDSYVNIPVIMHVLSKKLSDRPFWFAYTIHGAQIDERAQDGLSLTKYQSYADDLIHPPVVPHYPNGALVLITASAVKAMVAVNDIVGLRMLWDDDVAIGLWLSGFDVKTLTPEEAGCVVKPYRPADFGMREWDDVPMDNFCLDAPMPYCLVHPCKDPDIIRRVYETAKDCGDPVAPGVPAEVDAGSGAADLAILWQADPELTDPDADDPKADFPSQAIRI